MGNIHPQGFSKLEKSWIAYDIGNSAFTLLVATLIPIYYNGLAEAGKLTSAEAFANFSLATSITTLIVAFLGPTLGAVADYTGSKKRLFAGSVLLGIATMLAFVLPLTWFPFLVFFVVARVGYQASLVFYDSMLTDVTSHAKMDQVSSYGYALGYIMSCIPFVISLGFLLFGDTIGISSKDAMAIAILIHALWWFLFTIPLLKTYEQTHYLSKGKLKIGETFRGLGHTLLEVYQNKQVFFFLLAFFFYIDGVYTIINLAVAYGGSLGLDSTALLLALLMTQIVAFPSTLAFSRLAKTIPNYQLIQVCILGYTLIAAFAVQLDQEWEFWLLAIAVGLFQGGIQALSRSYFGQLIPPEKSGEYFGVYDIFGKGAAFVGTTLVAVISKATGQQHLGIVAIVVVCAMGFFLFRYALTKRQAP